MTAKLIYSAITSLDGYVADESGNFDWAAPDEEVHAAVNDLERGIGTYLYGRRMYDVMIAWEWMPTDEADTSAVIRDYAQIWRAADKVVYSRSLDKVRANRTRIERTFDPEAVASLKATAAADISIGGPELANQALRTGLVDECHFHVNPVIVGGGTPALTDGLRLRLELVDEHRFANGVVHLHYRCLNG